MNQVPEKWSNYYREGDMLICCCLSGFLLCVLVRGDKWLNSVFPQNSNLKKSAVSVESFNSVIRVSSPRNIINLGLPAKPGNKTGHFGVSVAKKLYVSGVTSRMFCKGYKILFYSSSCIILLILFFFSLC